MIRDCFHTEQWCDYTARIMLSKCDYETSSCCLRNTSDCSGVLHIIGAPAAKLFDVLRKKKKRHLDKSGIPHGLILTCEYSALNINQQKHAQPRESRSCLNAFLALFVAT